MNKGLHFKFHVWAEKKKKFIFFLDSICGFETLACDSREHAMSVYSMHCVILSVRDAVNFLHELNFSCFISEHKF